MFRNKKDNEGTNWFENSRKATLANRNYCIENKNKFKTPYKNFFIQKSTFLLHFSKLYHTDMNNSIYTIK